MSRFSETDLFVGNIPPIKMHTLEILCIYSLVEKIEQKPEKWREIFLRDFRINPLLPYVFLYLSTNTLSILTEGKKNSLSDYLYLEIPKGEKGWLISSMKEWKMLEEKRLRGKPMKSSKALGDLINYCKKTVEPFGSSGNDWNHSTGFPSFSPLFILKSMNLLKRKTKEEKKNILIDRSLRLNQKDRNISTVLLSGGVGSGKRTLMRQLCFRDVNNSKQERDSFKNVIRNSMRVYLRFIFSQEMVKSLKIYKEYQKFIRGFLDGKLEVLESKDNLNLLDKILHDKILLDVMKKITKFHPDFYNFIDYKNDDLFFNIKKIFSKDYIPETDDIKNSFQITEERTNNIFFKNRCNCPFHY